ncbi:OmpA family protein [Nafulsella turpanensis]|uniref:OmpA family protein n=1 Tax=Nafulsella turpanensis TaxID=1265690 RepID=UPI000344AB62|nr:OmpA family protein [Nafulsella turpanensis]
MKNYFLPLFLFLLLCKLPASAQLGQPSTEQTSTEKPSQAIKVREAGSLSVQDEAVLPVFKNVNKIPYYANRKKIKKIKKLEAREKWPELKEVLQDYVENFGIENFYKDTYFLWRLAKLTELMESPEAALPYYRLVLKHHRKDIDISKVELHYNEANKNEADLYVPLDYYYELVDYRRQVDTLLPPRSVLLNMGNQINSSSEDYAPALNLHNNLLLFTSKRNTEGRLMIRQNPNEDLYFSRGEGGSWMEAQSFKAINSPHNEGSATISRDGKTLYFSRCDSPDSYGNCDLFEAKMQPDSSWGQVRNMGVNLNSVAWDSHPSLSHTEDTLYFASDRIGGFGLSDIWFTYKNKKGEWQPAQNVGPVINTRQNELSPFIHPRYNILYFSSNGQLLNFGEFDIIKSYQLPDKASVPQWAEPKNIGPLVNGEGSEFYFTIDSESKDLFYARSAQNNMENLDLYSFPLPMEAQPLATTKLSGTLRNEDTNQPFKGGIVSVIDIETGIEVAPKYLRPDGSYEFDLIKDKNYLLVIQGDEFFRIEELFRLEDDMQMEHRTQSISKKLEFTTIDFASGSSTVVPEMYPDLNKLADFLIDHPDVRLKIAGHTDSDGDKIFNQKLSQQRAMAIMEYLVAFANVDPEQVEAIGYGSSRPLVEEKTEADKTLNRRVEFELTWEGEEK